MQNIEDAFNELNDNLPDRLGLVEDLVESFCGELPLAGVTVLMIQGQTGATFVQTKALINLGVAPENILWVDIPYASSQVVRQRLIKELGLKQNNFLIYGHDLLEPFTLNQRSRVNKLVRRLLERPPEELLVLDDGAYFIESAMCFKQHFPKLAIIEQSKRGQVKLNDNPALQYQATLATIMNLVETEAHQLEAPFVAFSIIRVLEAKLSTYNFSKDNKQILLLGYGRIGTRVANFLVSELEFSQEQITVYDQKFEDCQTPPDSVAGFKFWNRKNFEERFDLVIGCSGQTSFTVNDYIYLNDGGLLASCSSGQVEFERRDFIETADMHKNDDIKVLRTDFNVTDLHADIAMEFPDRFITLLNGAWPINYDGRVNNIPPQYLQPAICLVLKGAVQAVEALRDGKTGVIMPDTSSSEKLIRDFTEFLGRDRTILEE